MIHNMRQRDRRSHPFAWTLLLLLLAGGAAFAYFRIYPERLPEWAAKTGVGRDLQATTVYRWQDAEGGWHITDQPPAAGVDYQVDRYSHTTNVLPLPPKLRGD